MMVHEANAVQRCRLTVMVTEFSVQVQGSLAVDQRLLIIAEVGQMPADRVECAGLLDTTAGCAVNGQSLLGVTERLLPSALPPEHPGEPTMGIRLSITIAELAGQLEGVPEMG